MKTELGHLELHIRPASLTFYRDLFAFLGWNTFVDNDEMLGVGGANGASLWFVAHVKEGVSNDYDGLGVNHVAVKAGSIGDVDSIGDPAIARQHHVPLEPGNLTRSKAGFEAEHHKRRYERRV